MKPELVTIFEAVSAASGIPISAIRGRRRTRAVTWSRFVVISLVQNRFPWWSHSQLADVVGRIDHGTAAHALQRSAQLNLSELAFADLLSRSAAIASTNHP